MDGDTAGNAASEDSRRRRFDTRSAMVAISASGALPLLVVAVVSPTFLYDGALKWLVLVTVFTLSTIVVTLVVGRLTDVQFVILGVGGMLGVAFSASLIADPGGTRAVTSLLAVVPAIAASGSSTRVTTAMTVASVLLASILAVVSVPTTGFAVTLIDVGAMITTVTVPVVLIAILRRSLRALSREYRALANTDPLTRLANRRGLLVEADALLERAATSGRPLTVMVIDVDNFKSVNDTHGHNAGDRVLTEVAQIVSDAVSTPHTRGQHTRAACARLGGEEFIVLTIGDDGEALAQSILMAVREQSTVTVSIGTTSLRLDRSALAESGAEKLIDGLVQSADKALYSAKSQGRDRIVHDMSDPKGT